jgi:predicted phage tail protein
MLRTVKLYGPLVDIVGHREIEAHVNSVGESIRFLLMNWPQLEAHMNDQYYQVFIDGENIGEEELHHPVANEIKIIPVISGAGSGTGRFLLGALMIGVGVATGGMGFSLLKKGMFYSLSSFTATVGVGLALSGVSQMLMPMPDIPDFQDDQDPRISFGFSGIQNTSRAGTSHPICYGEVVTGSTVISVNVTTDQVTA